MKRADMVDIIEASYAPLEDDQGWIHEVLARAAPITARGLGVHTFFYDTREYPLRVWNMCETPGAAMTSEMLRPALASATPEYIEMSWKRLHCATASEVPGWNDEPARKAFFDSVGIKDVLAINAYDSSGVGCFIGTPLPKVYRLRGDERATFERVATHLAAGFRLRRRAREAEAILSATGAMLDASTDATKEASARAALRDAARSIDRARGAMRRRNPQEAVLAWRALVKARWSLVDQFESDGKRLLVAVANEPAGPPVKELSVRERHVMDRLMEGQTTKLIAYELGLSDSTVRVLLMRAMRTLGARTRADAIERYRRLLERD